MISPAVTRHTRRGAFSATIPLVTLYYGGFIDVDVADPTRAGQDLFVLSKGHAVAALASIYAELGYFDRSALPAPRGRGFPGLNKELV